MHESLEAQERNLRRDRRYLIYLLVFLILFLAGAVMLSVVNTGQLVFDSKGILTGTGALFAMLAAAALALVALLSMNLYWHSLYLRSFPALREIYVREERALTTWLSVDVLGGTEPAPAGWRELH